MEETVTVEKAPFALEALKAHIRVKMWDNELANIMQVAQEEELTSTTQAAEVVPATFGLKWWRRRISA
jgi:hypothetical protein